MTLRIETIYFGWALLLLNPLVVKSVSNFLGLKFLECLYFLDIYSIIPNNKDPLKVCILRWLK
ncbi:hypothetical protein C2R81_05940 [Helicobacter pylori]|nr:hypothetical protein C2R81_05940 [Helicobacter pylori]